jgi:PAS domain S-box-containing protein
VGIFRTDTEGVITYGNQKFWEILGIKGYSSMEEKMYNFVHPDDRDFIMDHLRSSLEKVVNFTFELRWGTTESFRWAMGELVPEVIDDEHHILGFIGVLTDVTERRQMEAEKIHAVEEVRAQQELAIGILTCQPF